MTEHNLSQLFADFLLSKGYPKDSLLFETAIKSKEGEILRADLLIIDLIHKQYLSIIEFKIRDEVISRRHGINTLKRYQHLTDSKFVPAFLVVPKNDNDFKIFQLINNELSEVSKSDYPTYNTISGKAIIDDILEDKVYNENIQKEVKLKKQTTVSNVIIFLVSIIAGFISILFTLNDNNISSTNNTSCCDSLTMKFELMNQKISHLTKKIDSINTNYSFDTIVSVNHIDSRLKALEDNLINSPDKILTLTSIKNELILLRNDDQTIKEVTDVKIKTVDEKINTTNTWIIGVSVTIFTIAIGLAITNFLKLKSS